ncbi:exosome complex component RRP4 [Tetranychus urticae]|uniref:Uncharacterized protein n=1 Tax=Tetranychus urticae TaxID=32264 RepID=T1KMI1_TETUR|nr:exosome complex component RRP4 [Tetranychus urticae]
MLCLPGDTVTEDADYMRGHGTYYKSKVLTSSVAGCIDKVNKLLSVRPLRTRYNGEIGDIVVGRVIDVQTEHKRWRIDTSSRLDTILLLSSVNLPGGELRRKTVEDELMMKSFFKEGDLISAEVQSIFADGALSVHTRNLKYGKLGQGVLLRVSPSLVERRKTHFHNLPCGVHLILGNNGYIWISLPVSEGVESGGFAINLDPVPLADREVISRVRNCILALAKQKMMLHSTSINTCYEISQSYQVKDLIKSKIMTEIAQLTNEKMKIEELQ